MTRTTHVLVVLVVVHALFVIAHAWAHAHLAIETPFWHNMYIGSVIILVPLIAMGMLLRGAHWLGTWLLLGAMIGAFVFGDLFHFVIQSHDHVSVQPAMVWGTLFRATAWGLALIEGLTAVCALWHIQQTRKTRVERGT